MIDVRDLVRNGVTSIFVANDYGAGVHLYEISKLVNSNKLFLFTGPSRSLLNQLDLQINNLNFLDELSDISNFQVFIGSGWQTELEIDAIQKCNQRKIEYFTVIENWVNYPERFIRDSKKVSPNKIIVFDDLAHDIAIQTFKKSEIYLVQNLYCNRLLKEFNQNKKDTLIIFLDPIINPMNLSRLSLIIEITYEIMEVQKISKLKLRPHPSEVINFNPLVTQFKEAISYAEVQVSIGNITDELQNCKFAIGIQTYALYIAATLGIKTYSVGKSMGLKVVLPSIIEVI